MTKKMLSRFLINASTEGFALGLGTADHVVFARITDFKLNLVVNSCSAAEDSPLGQSQKTQIQYNPEERWSTVQTNAMIKQAEFRAADVQTGWQFKCSESL